jgi:RimJ/RimL family protein N-acetyltransferase
VTAFVSSDRRVALRPLAYSDLPQLAGLVADSDVAAFLGAGRDAEDLERGLVREIERFQDTGRGMMAVLSVESGQFLGYVGFAPFRLNEHSGPELICAIRRESRGDGFGTEACRQALSWGFRSFDWPRVYASIAAANTRVRGLVEELGMRHVCERSSWFDGAQTVFSLDNPETAL